MSKQAIFAPVIRFFMAIARQTFELQDQILPYHKRTLAGNSTVQRITLYEH